MPKLNLKSINCIMFLCNLWKGICPFLSFAYLLTWLAQFFNEKLFNSLNKAFGLLPNIINKLIPNQTDLMGMDVPMGYIYGAVVIIISLYYVTKLELYVIKIKVEQEKELINNKIKKLEQEKQQKVKSNIQNTSYFFSLCELKLNYNKKNDSKSLANLKKLKKEYSKMIIQKIKSNFPHIYFAGNEKIFIIGNDYNIIDNLISDIIQYFKILQEIDNKKMIKTDLVLSIVGGNKHNNPKMIYKFLLKINELNYLNKIVVNDKFALKYNQLHNKKYEASSLGFSYIEMNINNHIETELYNLKKK